VRARAAASGGAGAFEVADGFGWHGL